MRLYFDTGTNNVAQELTTEVNSPGITIKRGVNVPLEIYQRKNQVTLRWDAGYYVKFVLKSKGKYEQNPPLGSCQTNTQPADDASPYLLSLNADDAAIRTAMLVDGNDANDPDFIDCMGAILYSPSGADNTWIESATIPVTLDNRVSQDDDSPPPAAIATRAIWLPAITDYVGGASNQLDSVPTLLIGTPQLAFISVGGVAIPYELIADTHATSSPDYIRGLDYAAVTNEKVWKRVSQVPGSGSITYPIDITNGGTGATDAPGARTNLQIATYFQGINANLTAIAGLSFSSADRFVYTTGGGAVAVAVVTAFARTLLDDVDNTAARSTLGAQASHGNLTALSGLSLIADRLPYANGTGTLALATLTSFGRALIAGASTSAQRTSLGLAIGTDVQAHNANLDGLAANTPGGPTVALNNVVLVLSAVSGNGSGLAALNGSAITSGTVPAARGGAGTVSGLLKSDGLGNVTAAVPGGDYTAPGAGAGINGQGRNFVCPTITSTSTAIDLGNALRAANTAAKALTPNGAAISATNRSRTALPPGVYNLGTTPLGLDGEHVDLVGITGDPRDVLITSQVTASSSGTVVQTASDVHFYGVTIQNTASTQSGGTSADASAYAPTTNMAGTVMENCILDDGGGASWTTRQRIEYSGLFRRVTGSDNMFGQGSGGVFSGVAIDCIGGANSFGGNFGALTGQLYGCRLTSGTFQTPTGGGSINYCVDGTGALSSGIDPTTVAILNSDATFLAVTINQEAFAGAPGLVIVGSTVTGASSPVLNLTQTWNDAPTSYTLIVADVTNTASAAGSRLIDLKVGGTSKFAVDGDGKVAAVGGTAPVADGTYTPVTSITTVGGIITAIS